MGGRPRTSLRDELADFSRDRRVLVLSLLAVVVGALATLAAALLMALIRLFTSLAFYHTASLAATSPAGHHLGLGVILVPVLGGIVIGLMARYGSPQIRGHGIPEALEAILIGHSRMDPKVTVLKPLSSAVSIGTGGPFGAEGPIIVTGGALGSLFAQQFNLSAAERKTLLVAGAAAGMTAIFSTPVAAVLLALEVMLFEWRPRSLLPVATAVAVAAAMRGWFFEPGPIFPMDPTVALRGRDLGESFILGLVAGFAAMAVTGLVYAVEDGFHRLSLHWMWWPAIGGLAVGLGGLLSPRAMGVGYDVINDLLHGRLVGSGLLLLLVVKTVIWAVALGSGTSGGVLAPLLIIGGALGAAAAGLVPGAPVGVWALLMMAAVLGGTLRAPLMSILFALETTHAVGLMPMLLVGCFTAYGLTVILMPRSILTAKVARRGHHLSYEYTIDPLGLTRVGAVMDPNPPTVDGAVTVGELSAAIAQGDPQYRRQGVFVLDPARRLLGIITRTDVLRALQQGRAEATVAQVCTRDLVVTHPDELLRDAAGKLLERSIGRLPVVDPDDPGCLLGYLGRADVMAGRQRWLEEERVPEEEGWLRKG